MNGSVVRTSSGAARLWRMRQWPNDPTVAHLIFVDHQVVPSPDVFQEAIEHARSKGARSIRTSALFPSATEVALASGFQAIDRLMLLRLELDDETIRHLPPPRHRIRTLHPWMFHRAASVDREAFGPLWGNDTTSLRDVRRATPAHRARMVTAGRDVVGFALSGAASDSGYLQRIAVSPAHRRGGIAAALAHDALRWMHADGRRRCLVNTGVENTAALELYERIGFRRLPDALTIAERRLTE